MKKMIAQAALCAVAIMVATPAFAGEPRQVVIPVLAATLEKVPQGTVAYVTMTFEDRKDQSGLDVLFKKKPGTFSRMTQVAIEEAIYRTANAMGMSPHSWTVILTLPYDGLTMYGNSCSAVVALSVIAAAKGKDIPNDRALTGTITPDGRIGAVGAVPLKVKAAAEAHLKIVIVPDEQDGADGQWETPFLVQVSPVSTVKTAFALLTENTKGDAR